MSSPLTLLIAFAILGLTTACCSNCTDSDCCSDWQPLFDGETTAGWRNFKSETISEGWAVEDGALTMVGGGGDIVTVAEYTSFELELEWKVAPGGNSGIFYHVTDAGDAVYATGPEMQILDDAGHHDGQNPLTSTGSCYALYAPSEDVSRPAGEWNQVRLIVDGAHAEHWLNGTKVVEYELWGDEWNALVAGSKFNAMPLFGTTHKGAIALQDHGDRVAFRNIRIREL